MPAGARHEAFLTASVAVSRLSLRPSRTVCSAACVVPLHLSAGAAVHPLSHQRRLANRLGRGALAVSPPLRVACGVSAEVSLLRRNSVSPEPRDRGRTDDETTSYKGPS